MIFFKNESFRNMDYDHVYYAEMSDLYRWGFDIPSATYVALKFIYQDQKVSTFMETLNILLKENKNEK